MAENSSPGNAGGTPKDAATAKNGTAARPVATGLPPPNATAGVAQPPATLADKPTRPRTAASSLARNSTNPLSTTAAQQATVKCPKCGATVREIARFCQRCHNTMRYECPACGHQQRTGGNCEKCGVNFIKYVTAVVVAKQAEADAIHDKIEQRSTLMKNLLFMPFTGGISLIRQFFVGRDRK
jgi:predicted RNA-binding Zn-ribbon protein involved in translation (DUF1610 family)